MKPTDYHTTANGNSLGTKMPVVDEDKLVEMDSASFDSNLFEISDGRGVAYDHRGRIRRLKI